MEKSFASRLKKILILAVILNLAIMVMQGFSSIKTISVSRQGLELIGRTALSSFEGGRRAHLLMNRGSAQRFRSFIDMIGEGSGVKSLYLFDSDGKMLFQTKKITPPHIDPTNKPDGKIRTDDGLFMYHTLLPMRHMMPDMMQDMNSGMMMSRRWQQQPPPSDEGPLVAGVLLDMSSYNNLIRSEAFFLIAMVALELLLIAVYVYTARILKMNSEQSKRLEASEREAELGKMSRLMAHELKNPLSTVKGLMEFSAKKSDGHLKEISESCVDELSRLDRIINDYLSYGKDIVLNISDTDIKEAAGSSARLLHIDTQSKEQRINITGSAIIKADAEKMRQVIFNLLINAVQGAPDGSEINVEISSKNLRISNPVGRKDFEADKLGQPFYTTKTVGTGLGLAIVKRIVQLHGFDMEITTDGDFTVNIRFS